MMARMPEWSSSVTSPTAKPRRLSISSCDSTRSPEFLPAPRSRLPSSTMAAHCRAMVSDSSFSAAAFAASAGSSESSEASHWAAIASWSGWSVPAMIPSPSCSLDHDFLEQHRADLDRSDRRVDALGQLFLEAEDAGGTVKVGGAQLARIGLEDVGDARHRRLDRLDLLLFLQLQHDLELQILHALARRAGEVDHDVWNLDERRRLRRRRRLGGMLVVAVAEKEEPGCGAAAEHGEQAYRHDHQLELVLGRSGLRALSGSAAFRFILCHDRRARSSLKRVERAKLLADSDAIQCPSAVLLLRANATVIMVNGT